MNILQLTTHINTGGITSYLHSLCQGLTKSGHKAFLVSSGGDRAREFSEMGVKNFSFDIRTKSELNPKIYFIIPRIIKLIQEHQIELIHSHTRVTQVMGTLLSRLMHLPYLSTCHGFFKPKWARTMFPCWGEKVIAISQQVADHLMRDFRMPKEKIYIIHNGIDIARFEPKDSQSKQQLRSRYQLGEGPILGIVARLSDVKGHGVLIKAMPRVVKASPEVKLLIVGEGKEEIRLKNLVAGLGLQKNILFYPVVNKTQEILSLLDVFVLPSRQEGLGLSVMEAQAAGLPVVATRVGGIPSLIKDRETGILVEPDNVDSLAEAIMTVLSDRKLANGIALNGRQFVHENFSDEKMVKQTINVYQDLLTSRE